MKIELRDAAVTEALGAAIANVLSARKGAVVYLEGELGAGKTTLARGMLRALGIQGPIRSPTYTLMEPYSVGAVEVLHMDLYRLNDPAELHNLGLSDYPPDRTLWLVEWPQRGQGLLPVADVRVSLSYSGDQRCADIAGFSAQDAAKISVALN